MWSSLFWDITQRRLIVTLPTFRDSLPVPSSWTALTLDDGTDNLSRKVGNRLSMNAALRFIDKTYALPGVESDLISILVAETTRLVETVT